MIILSTCLARLRPLATVALAAGFILAALAMPLPARAQTSSAFVPEPASSPNEPPSPLVGLDPTTIDPSIKPSVDFYKYANGFWDARNTIPADRSIWSIFDEAQRRNLVTLHEILDESAADNDADPDSDRYKVGAFYRSGMDTAAIDSAGVHPLDSEFARISAVRDSPSLVAEIAHLHRIGVGALFSFDVDADAKDSSRQMPQLGQGGIGLPDRDYYFKTDPDSIRIREAYIGHVRNMFVLLGDSPAVAQREAATVMLIERQLAEASKTDVDLRDPIANFNRERLSGLRVLCPNFDWHAYFTDIGILHPGAEDYDVCQPLFFSKLSSMVSSKSDMTGVAIPIADWRIYLRWNLIDAAAPFIASPFEREDFAFNQTTLQGATEMRPRWERVEDVIDDEIGFALGKAYVERTFSPEAKQKALAVVLAVKAALRENLANLTWMSPSTRRAALAKCDAMSIKVGYPDKWRDYSALKITDGSYVRNVFAANEFEFQRNIDKLDRPTDRGEWLMTPQTIDAYYDWGTNSINIPAAQLQPPFFDPSYDDAVNFGELGATAGHEMTHGFDDQGRLFDAHGNLHNWWTPQDAANFKARAKTVIDEYDAIEPLPGVHINGELTQGENIADIGGLKLAYIALEADLAGKPRTLIDGLTPEQRFFISYAQGWRTIERPGIEKEMLITDVHSPDVDRVNGPCYDLPEFYAAFGCKAPESAWTTGVW